MNIPIRNLAVRTHVSHDSPGSRVFEALANPYRRQLLLAMYEANPQDDHDPDPLDLLDPGQSSDDLEVNRFRMDHIHLPKLADMGFIEWDQESGELSKGPEWAAVAPLLGLIHDHQDELPDEWLSGPSPDG
jgi:hypothetical protein